MIAPATIALWACAVSAQPLSPPAADAAPAQGAPTSPGTPTSLGTPTNPAPAPAQPDGQPPAQPQTPAPSPAQTLAPPPAAPPGTPAMVLDAKEYDGVLGKSVRNVQGEDMGRIIDIILDKDGRPRAAIIDFGGFLGVGSRKIAVDWRSLRFVSDGKPSRPTLQLTRNQVRVSPEYKPGEPIVVLGPASPGAAPDGDQAAAPATTSVPAADKPAEKTPDK